MRHRASGKGAAAQTTFVLAPIEQPPTPKATKPKKKRKTFAAINIRLPLATLGDDDDDGGDADEDDECRRRMGEWPKAIK